MWIQGDRSDDPRASSGLRIYGSAATRFTNVGELVSVSGRVAEYRSSPNDLLLTEIDYITSITYKSSGHTVKPLVLGIDRIPPNNQLSSLDVGRDGWLSIPNNVTLLESVNGTLRPDEFGLDFWESLEGQLVTVKSPIATNFPDRFGSVWVYGDWPVTGKNERGGLTIHTDGMGATCRAVFLRLTSPISLQQGRCLRLTRKRYWWDVHWILLAIPRP